MCSKRSNGFRVNLSLVQDPCYIGEFKRKVTVQPRRRDQLAAHLVWADDEFEVQQVVRVRKLRLTRLRQVQLINI